MWCFKGVDESRNLVFFTGTADSPLERHLYACPLVADHPTPPVRLTAEPGMHSVKMDHSVSHAASDGPIRK